ncbi:T9SS type B sorting domain-containing protein [Flammeovirga sp. MY04]|uniref:Ig-like domain-containing protein n=1 Tax=Flammeovirga sp. MY04 TaxID=1191459 RepID=UPI000806286B|nr:Ig-like domain-containing protein [Flammeovirga sp. MY04]ANQ52077.1 T9SS type B sorting domain-containing protein [Flammeovirga sp. MY04]
MKKKQEIVILLLVALSCVVMGFGIMAAYTYKVLGDNPNALESWNDQGRPEGTYVVGTATTPIAETIALQTLVMDTIASGSTTFLQENNNNFIVLDDGDVYLTLSYEDAEWFNTLGFYTYNYLNPPTVPADIENTKTIIFPKLDTENTINNGFRLHLGYFTKGTVIGFFIVSQGWDPFAGNKIDAITSGRYTLHSNENLNANVVSPGGLHINFLQHFVIFDYKETPENDYILCVEDNMEEPDYDYNDAVFYVRSNPIPNITTWDGIINTPIVARDTIIGALSNVTLPFNLQDLITDEDPSGVTYTILEKTNNNFTVAEGFPNINITTPSLVWVSDTVKYIACDQGFPSACDTANIVIQYSNTNVPPIAVDNYAIPLTQNIIDNGVPITTLGVDPDNNLDPNSITIISNSDLTLPVTSDGASLQINPSDTWTGTATVAFQICDTEGACDNGSVVITRAEINQQIVARDTIINVQPNVVSNFLVTNLVEDDGDIADVTIRVDSLSNPNMFINTFNLPTIKVMGILGYMELDTVYYTACDNGSPQTCDNGIIVVRTQSENNNPPVAQDNLLIPLSPDILLNGIPVTTLGTDPDGNLNIRLIEVLNTPDVGLNLVNNNGIISLSPNGDYLGSDTIEFRICDSGSPALCDEGSFIVQTLETPPTANPDVINTFPNEGVIINPLTNDTEGSDPISPATLTIIQQPLSDTAIVRIVDGKVENITDPDFIGSYQIIYQICDNTIPALCDTSTITVNVQDPAGPNLITSTNTPPLALNDTVDVPFNSTVNIVVLPNDSDSDGEIDSIRTSIVVPPISGSASLNYFNNTPIITYTPNEGFTGVDVLTYRIYDKDNPQLSDVALVIIHVADESGVITSVNTDFWIDTVTVNQGATYCMPIQDRLDESSLTWNPINADPLVNGKVENSLTAIDNSNVCYTVPQELIENDTIDHVYYTVCNNEGDCRNGLLVININQCENCVDSEEPNLSFYSGFSPNGDNINEAFVIEGVTNYQDTDLIIYNRWGQPVYNTSPYQNQWEGNNNDGQPLPDGTYYYILKVRVPKEYSYNGFVVIKR